MNQQAAVTTTNKKLGIPALLEQSKEELRKVLPAHLTPDRMVRVALTLIRLNPRLAKADPYSFLGAIMKCSELGLEPASGLDLIYLIPFKNKKTNADEVNVLLGYKGMIELSLRSNRVKSIVARVVYERDTFDYSEGTEQVLVHKPYMGGDRGAIVCAYAVARLDGGQMVFEVMPLHEIVAVRDMVERKNRGESDIWREHFGEMARKTVVRRLWKYLPKTPGMAEASHLEALHEARRSQSLKSVANPAVEPTFDPMDAIDVTTENETDMAQATTEADAARHGELARRFNEKLAEALAVGYPADELKKRFKMKAVEKLTANELEAAVELLTDMIRKRAAAGTPTT